MVTTEQLKSLRDSIEKSKYTTWRTDQVVYLLNLIISESEKQDESSK